MNVSNVAETTQEIKSLSSDGQTLEAGDISNIATVLGKIVSVKQKANEVGLILKYYSDTENQVELYSQSLLSDALCRQPEWQHLSNW